MNNDFITAFAYYLISALNYGIRFDLYSYRLTLNGCKRMCWHPDRPRI